MKQKEITQINVQTLGQVHPELADACWQIIAYLKLCGHTLMAAKGFVPESQQTLVYEIGRTGGGPTVTDQTAAESLHTKGWAVRFTFVRDGYISWSIHDDVEAIGEAAKLLGLTWGGDPALKDVAPRDIDGRYVAIPDADYRMPDVVVCDIRSRSKPTLESLLTGRSTGDSHVPTVGYIVLGFLGLIAAYFWVWPK